MHTAYIRNDNSTRLLVGDVYHAQRVIAALDLRIGPVGILVPLRGRCEKYCDVKDLEWVCKVWGGGMKNSIPPHLT